MIKMISVAGRYRLALMCEWCHQPITEDIEGNCLWRVRNQAEGMADAVFLHTRCTHSYETTHCLPNETWEWFPLTTLDETVLLEKRLPLKSLRVHTASRTTNKQLQIQRADEHALIINCGDLADKSCTIVLGGGTIMLDLDGQQQLTQIEVNIPRDLWRMAPAFAIPHPTHQARLIFPDAIHSYEWIEETEAFLSVRTNSAQSYVYITLGEQKVVAHWIALADDCFAALAGDELQGLFVWLRHEKGAHNGQRNEARTRS